MSEVHLRVLFLVGRNLGHWMIRPVGSHDQMLHKVAPSTLTNNRMVLKPSKKTPIAALLLADVLYEVGLPPAMFSVVTGDSREIGDELLKNDHAVLALFSGGVSIGHHFLWKYRFSTHCFGAGW